MAKLFSVDTLVLKKQAVTATGNNLYVNGLLVGSGIYQAAGDYVNITDLNATGEYLLNQIVSLSGDVAATGNSLNGRLISTGSALLLRVETLSGDLTNTGINLLGRLVSLSGDLQATGNTLNGNIINTGSNLFSRIESLSGNLTNTGITLINRDISLSGDLAATGNSLNGRLIDTGSDLLSRLVLDSGHLTDTGVAILNKLISLSGDLLATGQSIPVIKVTGSSNILNANFTGLGGTLIIYSGDKVFISGAAQGVAAGVDTVNDYNGDVKITGSGTVTVFNIGGQIIVSGTDGGVADTGSLNYIPNPFFIENSLRNGTNLIAGGPYSHAEGADCIASEYGAHAEGQATWAANIYAHAEGANTIASGDTSHTEGSNNISKGDYSHSEGSYCVTENGSSFSHAEGANSRTFGYGAHAEGTSTVASGDYSHSEGEETKSLGASSHAEGASTETIGLYSHAEGDSTIAYLDYSHAEGRYSASSGYASHAEGFQSITVGNFSHAEGDRCETTGLYSHAEGGDTRAVGQYSHAEGMLTVAIGYGSNAAGYYTIAEEDYSYAGGIFNRTGLSGLFQIGRGANGNRSDILYIPKYNNTCSILSGKWLAEELFIGISGKRVITGVIDGSYITSTNNNNGTITISVNGNFATAENLTNTGITLINQITSLSGDLAATGNSLNERLLNTGSDILSRLNIDSGHLTDTGIALLGQIISLSGDVKTTGNTLNNNLINTGSSLLSRIEILSGNLTQTGLNIPTIKVTGSTNILAADFSGIGGTLVFTSGGKILVSGTSTSGPGAGVSSINSLTNDVLITGAGSVTVSNVGNTIYISGSAATSTGGSIISSGCNFFTYNVPSGQSEFYVPYPTGYYSEPVLNVTVENSTNTLYFVNVKTVTTTGFTALLSSAPTGNYLQLNVNVIETGASVGCSVSNVTVQNLSFYQPQHGLVFFANGNGGGLTTGSKAIYTAPFTGVITGFHIAATTSGYAYVLVEKCSFENFPDGLTSIMGDVVPKLENERKSSSNNTTNWTTEVNLNDMFRISLTGSTSGISMLTFKLGTI